MVLSRNRLPIGTLLRSSSDLGFLGAVSLLNLPASYFSLLSRCSLVKGATKSLILDFANGRVLSVDSKVARIIEMGGERLRFPEALEKAHSGGGEVREIFMLAKEGLIRFSDDVMEATNDEPIPPKLRFLWVEVTNRCNLHCVHCYTNAEVGQGSVPDIPLRSVIRILDEASEMGCRTIQLTGGEPLMRQDLGQIIEEAVDRHFHIEVFSNLTLLTEPLADLLVRENVAVATSFYSYKNEVHDSITGVQGSCGKTLSAMRLLVRKEASLRCEVIRISDDKGDIRRTAHLLLEEGIATDKKELILPVGRGEGCGANKLVVHGPCVGEVPRPIFSHEYRIRRRWNSCWFGKAAICNNGDVLPCIFARGQVAGNIFQECLKNIIHGKLIDYWGMNKEGVQGCRDCEYRYNCMDCPPLVYALTGRFDAKPPFCTYDPYSGSWATSPIKHGGL